MRTLVALRSVTLAAALAGVFIAFAWPFAVSDDPSSAGLRFAGVATFALFLVSLAATACLSAVTRREGEG